MRLTAASLLLFVVGAGAQTPPVLTINDAVALALKQIHGVQNAALEVDRTREDTAATKTSRLTQFKAYVLGGEALTSISFMIPQGALGNYPVIGPIPAPQATVTQPRSSRRSTGFKLRSRFLSFGRFTLT